jgi:hypothetical protein
MAETGRKTWPIWAIVAVASASTAAVVSSVFALLWPSNMPAQTATTTTMSSTTTSTLPTTTTALSTTTTSAPPPTTSTVATTTTVRTVSVPGLTGHVVGWAEGQLTAVGLNANVQSASSGDCTFTDFNGQPAYNTNGVMWQVPQGGSVVDVGSTVTLGVC